MDHQTISQQLQKEFLRMFNTFGTPDAKQHDLPQGLAALGLSIFFKHLAEHAPGLVFKQAPAAYAPANRDNGQAVFDHPPPRPEILATFERLPDETLKAWHQRLSEMSTGGYLPSERVRLLELMRDIVSTINEDAAPIPGLGLPSLRPLIGDQGDAPRQDILSHYDRRNFESGQHWLDRLQSFADTNGGRLNGRERELLCEAMVAAARKIKSERRKRILGTTAA
jgi:hypothetical protein